MIYLLLVILLATMFLQLFRLAQARGGRLASISMINFAVASAASLIWWWQRDAQAPEWLTILMGVGNGVLYLVHLFVLLRAMKLAGLGLTTAVTNTSSVVPVLMGFLFLAEPVTAAQWIAVAIMPAALYLMRRGSDPVNHLSAAADFWLLGSMLIQGVMQSVHKIAEQSLAESQQPMYNVCLFAAAAAVGLLWTARTRAWPRPVEFGMGGLIGAANAGVLLALLLGLRELPSATFFTIGGTAVIALNVVSGKFLWGEQLQRRHWAGLALAILVVALAQQSGNGPAPDASDSAAVGADVAIP